jgi:outer membrane receptor protein involved in Fe transport
VSTLALANAAHAQDAAGSELEEVVITGSRIVSDGTRAPTPVTVATTEALAKSAPTSIPDGLNQLPQFSNSRSAQNPGASATAPNAGNYLNLRGIGVIRGLVLLDGQRVPPTSYDGTVDTNIIPQLLISRVDVVTGGASAAYGSDAVSGVINFVLDTKFNGVKGTFQAGVSDYKDDRSWKGGIAIGGNITDKLHGLFSAEHYERDGIPDNADRPNGADNWIAAGQGTAANPIRVFKNAAYISATYGTVINNNSATMNPGNPLRGYHFLPNGQLVKFNSGIPTGTSNYSYNSDGAAIVGHALTGKIITDQLFGRLDYELTPDINLFAQLTFAESYNRYNTVGSGTQLGDFRIFTENPFLPAGVRQTMEAAGFTSFIGGRIGRDVDYKWVNALNDVYTFLAGAEGKLGDYRWKATYSHGDSLVRVTHFGNFINRNWYAALDAVRGPNGNIVCRITVTNPGLQDDCVPINIFGDGSVTKAANDYAMGESQYQISQKMDVFAGEISGELFNLPAGPVAFAAGAEYRRQELIQTTNSDPASPVSLVGLRTNVNTYLNRTASTNVGKANGEYNVKEAFIETQVPILRDQPFAYNLELNAAARYTDYSTSGGVTTWKVGVSYQPIEELRFRYTRSKDIRAPTLYELFAGDSAGRGPFNDIHTNVNQTAISLSSGNPNLTPEEGNTYTVGVVWQPDYIPGFSASLDYYNIEITDVITNISTTFSNEECEKSNGTSPLCANIVRPLPFSDRSANNFPISVRSTPFNQAIAYYHGIDYEVGYRVPLDKFFETDAQLSLRLIGGYNPTRKTKTTVTAAPVQTANTGGTPKHRFNLVADYVQGPVSLNLQARVIGEMNRTRDPTLFFVDNTIGAVTYFDTTVSYKFNVAGRDLDAFLTVNNLLNKNPPFVPARDQPGITYPTVQAMYDVVGRYYTTGIRFKF